MLWAQDTRTLFRGACCSQGPNFLGPGLVYPDTAPACGHHTVQSSAGPSRHQTPSCCLLHPSSTACSLRGCMEGRPCVLSPQTIKTKCHINATMVLKWLKGRLFSCIGQQKSVLHTFFSFLNRRMHNFCQKGCFFPKGGTQRLKSRKQSQSRPLW